jgi:hypothetical protein
MSDIAKLLSVLETLGREFRGDMNISQWCSVLTSFNGAKFNDANARVEFLRASGNKIDAKMPARKLLPVIFDLARPNQMESLNAQLTKEIHDR